MGACAGAGRVRWLQGRAAQDRAEAAKAGLAAEASETTTRNGRNRAIAVELKYISSARPQSRATHQNFAPAM